ALAQWRSRGALGVRAWQARGGRRRSHRREPAAPATVPARVAGPAVDRALSPRMVRHVDRQVSRPGSPPRVVDLVKPGAARTIGRRLFALALVVYLSTAGGSLTTTDAVVTFDLTQSIVERGTVALSGNLLGMESQRGRD